MTREVSMSRIRRCVQDGGALVAMGCKHGICYSPQNRKEYVNPEVNTTACGEEDTERRNCSHKGRYILFF